MGIAEESVTRLQGEYPDLIVLARRQPSRSAVGLRAWLHRAFPSLVRPVPVSTGPVCAVQVKVKGIRGGHNPRRRKYHLILDTTDLDAGLPPTWVASPADEDIRHVNIWPAGRIHCSWAATPLPSICWNSYEAAWLRAPSTSRTLGAALEYVKQLLNTENHDSPAR